MLGRVITTLDRILRFTSSTKQHCSVLQGSLFLIQELPVVSADCTSGDSEAACRPRSYKVQLFVNQRPVSLQICKNIFSVRYVFQIHLKVVCLQLKNITFIFNKSRQSLPVVKVVKYGNAFIFWICRRSLVAVIFFKHECDSTDLTIIFTRQTCL